MRPRLSPAAGLLAAALLAGGPAGAAPHPSPPFPNARCDAPSCHAGIAAAPDRGSAHEPAAAGECAACHDLALRAAPFVRDGAAAEGADAALCAGCHDGHARSGVDPSVRTAFAEGARDLHGVHVRAAGRGRVCLTCHDPHAGAQARLLRAEIAGRGGLRLSQRFEARPDGGRCTTRCHAPREYRR